jgi:hypothetical protein
VHHTRDPRASFGKLVELARPGGIIVLGVYNAIARIPTRLRACGGARVGLSCRALRSDPSDRAHDPDAPRGVAARSVPPSRGGTRHTIAEVQRWFAEHGVEYLRTYPSAVFDDTPERLVRAAADNWGLERLAHTDRVDARTARARGRVCSLRSGRTEDEAERVVNSGIWEPLR